MAPTMYSNESLNRLQKYTNTQSKQKNTIEKGTEQLSPLPTKVSALGDSLRSDFYISHQHHDASKGQTTQYLQCNKGNDKPN
jgi:hypothetical protein